MFVFLSKFLPLLVYPLGFACTLLFLGILIRKPKMRSAFLITALLLLWLGGNRWVSYSLARSLEWQYLPKGEIPTAGIIVVLGGGTEPALAPRATVEVNSAGDRILYAARLFHEGKAEKILLSGGNISWLSSSTSTPADDMAEILAQLGVPPEAILIQTQSENTHDDAVLSTEMLDELGAKRIILVTSAIHMPRSVALFKQLGVEVIPAPTDFTVTEAGWDSLITGNIGTQLINLIPNASSLALTTNALKEYLGLLVYGLRGWL